MSTTTQTSSRVDDAVAVAEFRTYTKAQDAVDHLSDQRFPVADVTIVGDGLTSVERVTGRLTKGRAALAGAGTGAWVGLLLGLLLGLFAPGIVWVSVILTSLVMGALWGAGIGFVAHWATRGRRDFTSLHGLTAERFTLMVRPETADEAMRLLAARREGLVVGG
jgi:hypothetical protein